MRHVLLMIGCLCLGIWNVNGQTVHTIPAFTGYAVPMESGGQELFSETKGVQHWTDPSQELQYYCYLRNTGTLTIQLNAKASAKGSDLLIRIDEQSFPVRVVPSTDFKKTRSVRFDIKDSGFYCIRIGLIKNTGDENANIASLELSGTATDGMHYNPKPRRNAASVHLKYPIADTAKLVAFYNEIKVPVKADLIHSYYMSNGFARGYFGIQVNGPEERRVIFSVWDAGNEALSRSKVADSNRVQLLAKGADVFADDFGNEGTGGHSHWVYPWKAGQTYSLLVTALTDSISRTTTYTGYFFVPELKKWKLIASFRAPRDGKPLRGLYSFNENFVGINGQQERKAYFGNQWVQLQNGNWVRLNQAVFTCDATGKAKDRIDIGAGTEQGMFYLWNGGFKPASAVYGQVFMRDSIGAKPQIDWTANADSAVQAASDLALIRKTMQGVALDSTVNGLYYQILEQGNGAYASINDTVTVHYKGWLLKDGTIFDQTKIEPASFPLKRLIKGWQIGLPQCKVGGKIRLVIPSGLAYGIRNRSKDIPPNSVLVFDISLLNAKH